MKILIQGSNILAVGSLIETADAITSDDAVYPKHVISGWQIVDATLPEDYAPGKYTFNAGVFTLKLIPVTAEARDAFILKIDTDVDALIRKVIGERTSEYELAEKEANAYKAAGYTGTVPGSVSAWAIAKSWKPKVAADSIIATAAAWRSAQASMRATRLLSKEQARVTVDVAALDAIKVQWDEFMVALKLQLNV